MLLEAFHGLLLIYAHGITEIGEAIATLPFAFVADGFEVGEELLMPS
jgi:hypothetical protein